MDEAAPTVETLLVWARAAIGRSWVAGIPAVGRTAEHHVGWDASPAQALLSRTGPSTVTVAEVLRNGTLGLGAADRSADGAADRAGTPVVVIDRRCFALRPDGTAVEADPADPIPFAVVSTFSPDLVVPVRAAGSRAALQAQVDAALPSEDFAVGVRAEGAFARVRTRGTTARVSEHRSVTGSLVGFRTPGPVGGGDDAVHHLAFLDASHRHGGALVDFEGFSGRVELGLSTGVRLSFPRLGAGFATGGLTPRGAP
jgi:acetolactate decarboxylase